MNTFARCVMLVACAAALSACSSKPKRAPSPFLKQQSGLTGAGMVNIKIQLAIEYMKARDYRAAVEAIDEALKINSRSEMAWLVRAEIYQYLKVPQKADESFRQALAIRPDSAEINNNYGWFLCDFQKQPAAAIAHFDRALADPTYPTPQVAYMNKGICLGRMSRYAEATALLEKARAANPGYLPVIKEMARIKYFSGYYPEANTLFKQYTSSINVLSEDDLLLGWQISRGLGDAQAAYEYEAQLRSNYPYSPEMQKITGGQP